MRTASKAAPLLRDRVEAIRAANPIADVVRRHTTLLPQGRELVGKSPLQAERNASFTVDPRRGVWYCFSSGQGGDVFDFVMALHGCDFAAALKMLGGDVTEAPPARSQPARVDDSAAIAQQKHSRQMHAQRIWLNAKIDPQMVALYLGSRGVNVSALASIPQIAHAWRFAATEHPELRGFHPCLVAPIVTAHRSIVGVHRTYVEADGSGKLRRVSKAKLCLGQMMGGLNVLTDTRDPVGVLGEGIETTLSVVAALAARGQSVWSASAISLTNLAYPPAVSEYVKELILLADADGRTVQPVRDRLNAAAAEYRKRGLRVRIAWPELGRDFCDMAHEAHEAMA